MDTSLYMVLPLIILGALYLIINTISTDKYKIEIDHSKPLYIIINYYEIIYVHMESYHCCRHITYPTARELELWRTNEYEVWKKAMIELGIKEEASITFERWAKMNKVGADKNYKDIKPPELTHPCEVFHDSAPMSYHNIDFLHTLVKERYPQYFN